VLAGEAAEDLPCGDELEPVFPGEIAGKRRGAAPRWAADGDPHQIPPMSSDFLITWLIASEQIVYQRIQAGMIQNATHERLTAPMKRHHNAACDSGRRFDRWEPGEDPEEDRYRQQEDDRHRSKLLLGHIELVLQHPFLFLLEFLDPLLVPGELGFPELPLEDPRSPPEPPASSRNQLCTSGRARSTAPVMLERIRIMTKNGTPRTSTNGPSITFIIEPIVTRTHSMPYEKKTSR